jgi:hypothetical protein
VYTSLKAKGWRVTHSDDIRYDRTFPQRRVSNCERQRYRAVQLHFASFSVPCQGLRVHFGAPRPWASKSEAPEAVWERLVAYLKDDAGPAAIKAAAAKRAAAGNASRKRHKAHA